MHLGAWRPRVKRQLRPHQPELFGRLNSGSNRRLAPASADVPLKETYAGGVAWSWLVDSRVRGHCDGRFI
jgi:hypothetical protein